TVEEDYVHRGSVCVSGGRGPAAVSKRESSWRTGPERSVTGFPQRRRPSVRRAIASHRFLVNVSDPRDSVRHHVVVQSQPDR
ncbi:Protein oar, partial [Clarias magur]